MRRRSRAAIAAAAIVTVLAVPTSALGAYTPRFVVNHNPHNLAMATTQIKVAVGQQDDATAFLVFFAPLGYSGALGQAPGTKIGTVETHVIAKAIDPNAVLPVNGQIVTDDPAKYTTIPAAIFCAGPAQHDAVWLLNLSAAGRQLAVPLYVDTVSAGPEAGFASFEFRACLPSPDVPESLGGAALGAKFVDVTLNLDGVFRATTPGQYVWPAFFFPYNPGTATVNVGAATQARAIERLPGQATLRGRSTRSTSTFLGRVLQAALGTVRISGSVTENRIGIGGAIVEILKGARVVGRARTASNGSYSLNLKRKGNGKLTTLRARARVPERNFPAGCNLPLPGAPPGLPPCTTATLSGFTALSAAIRVRL